MAGFLLLAAPAIAQEPTGKTYQRDDVTDNTPLPPPAVGDTAHPEAGGSTGAKTPVTNKDAVTPITSETNAPNVATVPTNVPVTIGSWVLPDYVQKWFNHSYLARANELTPHGVRGRGEEWGIGLQKPETPIKDKMEQFYGHWLFNVITAICVFVLAAMLYIAFRFSAKRNPVPSTRTHNVPLEIIWTIIPVLILMCLAVPSFKLLYFAERIPEAAMTIKVTGHQWYWEYQYPDEAATGEAAATSQNKDQPQADNQANVAVPASRSFSFNSTVIPDKELAKGQLRLLDVDNPLVVPAGQVIRIQVTAADVLHGFYIPSFGINKLAVPGRLDQVWIKVNQPGHYYGQCSKICGINHAYMPISVIALSPEDFKAWSEQAKTKYSDSSQLQLAAQ